MGQTWGPDEPSLNEVISEPIVEMMMRTDGVTVEALWSVIRAAQARLQRRIRPAIGHGAE